MSDDTTTTTVTTDTTTTVDPNVATTTGATTTTAQAAWFDSFDDIKADPKLAEAAGKFKSPAEALRSLQAGWGDNWRESFAGDDKDKLERLQRYQSPKAVIDALVAAQDKIRSGATKPALPANPNEQELKAYREAHGIPEQPGGYLENLPDGLVIGEDDKPIFESFVTALHAEHADPKIAHAAVKWYNNFVEEQQAAESKADLQAKQAAEDTLRAEWGRDYRTNINVIQSYMDTMPTAVAEALQYARGADGVALFNNPEFAQWFAGFAREANSVQTLVGDDGRKHGQSLEDEIGTIEKFMRTNRRDYDRDPKMQDRLRQLYDARIKAQERSGKAA
jgi:hypothetical protein